MLLTTMRTLCFAICLIVSSSVMAAPYINLFVTSYETPVVSMGFVVNGVHYGGDGVIYSRGNLPGGAVYHFKARVDNIRNAWIDCGKRKLSRSASVRVFSDGEKCYVRVSSRP